MDNRSPTTLRPYPEADSEVRLMLRVRDDEVAAFEELVTRYQHRLLTILYHWTGQREWAEDLAQEVFLRIFRARKQYEPQAKFATWLFTIVHNVVHNARRGESRRREVSLSVDEAHGSKPLALEEWAQASSGQMPTRQLDRIETASIVRMALDSLGERQRLAVLLAKFEDLSYADIGKIMDQSPQAIKSLLCRARQNLRGILQPYLEAGHLPAALDPFEGTIADGSDKRDP